jgi:S1-C subfamily serine protease
MTEQLDSLAALSDGLADAVARGARSTVLVDGRSRLPASGVVWSADGAGAAIVTADHVLERDDEISVGLPDGSEVAATIAGRDPGSDLAVLRVAASGLEAAEQAPEGGTRVGHLVLALGRPTAGGPQASLGVVSAIGGAWRTFRGGRVDGYLRPDVTFYPGFSGGPLVDARGRVAGINSSRLRRGAGLTIPSAAVAGIAGTLLEQGRIRRGYLGVASQPARLPEALAAQLDGQDTGLLIVSVEGGSPADAAGLLIGDILVRIDGARLEDHAELQAALGADRVGRATPLTVLRGGEARELSVTVGERG